MSGAHVSADKPNGLVPQDAALADYLDGLLKEDQTHPPVFPVVKLALVTAPPLPSAHPEGAQIPNAFTEGAEANETPAPYTPEYTNDLTLELPPLNPAPLELHQGEPFGYQPSSSIAMGINALSAPSEPNQAQAAAADIHRADLLESAVKPQVKQDPPSVLSDALPNTQESPWRIFSAGAIKIAIARTAIKHLLTPAPLKPIAGAPLGVAGIIELEGRTRMVLSLPDWLGAKKFADTALTFGEQGLWGLSVGAEVFDCAWDEAQTSWRTADEHNPARPGFIGFNQAAGLVFIDPCELRALLVLTR